MGNLNILVYQNLKSAVLSDVPPAGQHGGKRPVSQKIGIDRTPFREVTGRLQGLVEKHRK